MGGCCYGPRRTQFLWWYWLLLASIVGLPMLIACLYLNRNPIASDELRVQYGRKAVGIFWTSSVLIGACWLVAAMIFGSIEEARKLFLRPLFPILSVCAAYIVGIAIVCAAVRRQRSRGLFVGLLGFVLCLVGGVITAEPFLLLMATGGLLLLPLGIALGRTVRFRETGNAILVMPSLAVLLAATVYSTGSVAEIFWLIAALLVPANFFVRFAENATKQTARAALVALVLGVAMFGVAASFGRAANYVVYSAVRGTIPAREKLTSYIPDRP